MGSQPNDPNDVEALQRQIAELQAKLAAAQQATVEVQGDNFASIDASKKIETQGGAVIESGVRVRDGHFIGRDFVQSVTQIIQGSEDPEEAKSVIALYLHALATDLASVRLGEIDSSVDQARRDPLQLADIYVPLDTTLRIPKDTTLGEWLSRERSPHRAEPDDTHEHREPQPVSALEAVELGATHRDLRLLRKLLALNGRYVQHHTQPVSALEALAAHRELTLLGKPGSGKSTFGASVLLALVQAWQGHDDQLAKLGETWTHGPLLPIRVVLRRFAEQLPPGDQPARAGDLWAFIARGLDESGYGLSTETMKYVQRMARNHGALIVLDGLDECGDQVRRSRVLDAVNELMKTASHNCRFLLTARPYAWSGGPDPDRGVYMLADLNEDQIEQFIRAWYGALVHRKWLNAGEAGLKLDDLLQARHRPDLLPLCQIPLLLTLMATLHTNRGRLPDDRADLYNESVELLMLRWNRQIGADKALLDKLAVPGLKLSGLREVLEELAFRVHEENVGREGTADIGEDRLVRAFRPLLSDSRDKAAVVVDYIEKRAGLLIAQGEKHGEPQFTFPHRTFQEFLAACYLASQGNLNELGVGLARAHAGHWKEVLVLAARQAKSERGASLADAMIGGEAFDPAAAESTTSGDFVHAVVAAEQLLEIGLANLASSKSRDAVRKRVATWLAGGLQASEQVPEPSGRASIGDLVSALGDPRFDRDRFFLPADDMLGFVRIPADPDFRIGTRQPDVLRYAKASNTIVRDDEINDAFTPTPEFYIARYPVTVAQFKAFVEDTHLEVADADALQGAGSRPVRYVSWHESLAYCDWMQEKFAASPAFQGSPIASLVREQGWRVTLPRELEWEKAARGGLRDTVFSWGDTPDPNRANYGDSGIGDASAVGCFPANRFGLYDMVGNLWEWTRSHYRPYPYLAENGRESREGDDEDARIVRGGSFGRFGESARCAYRRVLRANDRGAYTGFRVVLRSPPGG
jgi:formylglycine-generating enzyme required for sulfatase activity